MSDNQNVKDRLLIYIKYLGIGQSKFEKLCGLSNGYINNSKGNFGSVKLEDILKACPELNREWLLYGEGEMLNGGIVQEVQGDGNTSVAGNGNNVNTAEVLVKALAEIEEHRKLLSKKDEQIDRLLSVIDKLTNK